MITEAMGTREVGKKERTWEEASHYMNLVSESGDGISFWLLEFSTAILNGET